MTNYPMVEQVNRLTGNLLAAGDGVFLPGVGTLGVERHVARRLSKRSLVPPCRTVVFSSRRQAVSLVERIAEAGGCGMAEAQDIYDRWLVRTKADDVLTIEGVGVLKFKHFTVDPNFDARLNPQGHDPVRIASAGRSDWVIWVGGAAVVAALCIGGYLLWEPQKEVPSAAVPVVAAQECGGADAAGMSAAEVATADAAGPEASSGSGADIPDAASEAVSDAASDAAPAAVPASARTHAAAVSESGAPARMTSGRRYVVLGVYSTPANARRAAADAAEKNPAVRCGVYRFGEKYMVSPFESEDAEACTLFIRAHSGEFPGMWTYAAR